MKYKIWHIGTREIIVIGVFNCVFGLSQHTLDPTTLGRSHRPLRVGSSFNQSPLTSSKTQRALWFGPYLCNSNSPKRSTLTKKNLTKIGTGITVF